MIKLENILYTLPFIVAGIIYFFKNTQIDIAFVFTAFIIIITIFLFFILSKFIIDIRKEDDIEGVIFAWFIFFLGAIWSIYATIEWIMGII